jgi:ADP-ribosylglycohydrolase
MINYKRSKSKYIGCMLGAAIGDALGKQNEGVNREDILRRGCIKDYGKASLGTPGDKLKPGDYTDDTEQMLVLAGSLIDNNGFDAIDFSQRIAKWGKDALEDPIRKSFVGPTSAIAIERLYSGVSWKESGGNIPSCGSAMRVAPVGLFYDNLEDVESNAALSSIPTHNSKIAIAGAVAVAIAVRCAFEEKDCADIISETCARTSKYDTGLAEKIKLSFELKDIDPDEVFSELGTSYLALDTVPCAFYCFAKYCDTPESAIIESVNAGGDTDSIACITGALCGALRGSNSIPARWIEGLENRGLIEETAEKMYKHRYSSFKNTPISPDQENKSTSENIILKVMYNRIS